MVKSAVPVLAQDCGLCPRASHEMMQHIIQSHRSISILFHPNAVSELYQVTANANQLFHTDAYMTLKPVVVDFLRKESHSKCNMFKNAISAAYDLHQNCIKQNT